MKQPPTWKRLVSPLIDLDRLVQGSRGYPRYLRDLRTYKRASGLEQLASSDLQPELSDRTERSAYDEHYFFQDVWAARHVANRMPRVHVDVGSRVDYVGFLTALTEVVFVDIRPLGAQIDRLTSVNGSVLSLPFDDRSVESISCLHVAEHVGLGRYGDPFDPGGTGRAADELQRVLAPGGQLLFSVPVGRPRVCFNAHRIHSPGDVVAMFPALELLEFSGVDDDGRFTRGRALEELAGSAYGCGLFRFGPTA